MTGEQGRDWADDLTEYARFSGTRLSAEECRDVARQLTEARATIARLEARVRELEEGLTLSDHLAAKRADAAEARLREVEQERDNAKTDHMPSDHLAEWLESALRADIDRRTPNCLGCGGAPLVGWTIDRKPGPFCRACWNAVKASVRSLDECDRAEAERGTEGLLAEVVEQLAKAEATHAPLREWHEGYAVILEELDELWVEVKRQQLNTAQMRKEALHVAAMGLRFVKDLCDQRAVAPAPEEPRCVKCGRVESKGHGFGFRDHAFVRPEEPR